MLICSIRIKESRFEYGPLTRMQQGTETSRHGDALPKTNKQDQACPHVRISRQDEDQKWSQDDQSQATHRSSTHAQLLIVHSIATATRPSSVRWLLSHDQIQNRVHCLRLLHHPHIQGHIGNRLVTRCSDSTDLDDLLRRSAARQTRSII